MTTRKNSTQYVITDGSRYLARRGVRAVVGTFTTLAGLAVGYRTDWAARKSLLHLRAAAHRQNDARFDGCTVRAL